MATDSDRKPKDDGGPAFPQPLRPADPDACDDEEGMSLRDFFAAHAMGAFVRSFKHEQYHSDSGNVGVVAEKAYRLADAMIRERAK